MSMSGGRLQREPPLLRAARAGEVKLGALFGGQGFHNRNCVDDLAHLHRTCPDLISNLFQRAAYLLDELAATPHPSGFHEDWGLDFTRWLADPSSVPPKEHLALAPVSFPLNTLLALAQYCIACRRVSCTPGELRSALVCSVGYSQGVFAAAAIANSTTWNSFWEATECALRLSFGVGLESHICSPPSGMPPSARKECIENNHGQPSPMLSIAGLSKSEVSAIVKRSNEGVESQGIDTIYLALEVSRDRNIVAGSINSLWKLCLHLRRIRAPEGLDQDRIPFNERKPTIDLRFLPISAPFHSLHLEVVESVMMVTPTYWSSSLSLQNRGLPIVPALEIPPVVIPAAENSRDFARALIRSVTVNHVGWQEVSQTLCQDLTHLLDFGPGRMGDLVAQNTLGSSLSVINMTDGDGQPKSRTGMEANFYSSEMPPLSLDWKTRYAPHVAGVPPKGNRQVQTKMAKVFGTPPVMVSGMVPTTTHSDVVAAIMQAGYHAELGGGGYYNEASFERAVRELAAQIPAHRGVTCNLIYANPQTIAWQVSCLRRLIREGVAVSGLTIGAGIPSDEAVAEYIEHMGLRHISFKPGSISAIRRVIEIAQKYPNFTIGLQWTGGRAGGHHSSEDFHAAMLTEYGRIRACENIILIAGSGFGGGPDSMPYLSGEWSLAYGYPAMPFDGILLGSRMMVCKEAHTSPAAKRLIVEAEGVSDAEWHHSYRSPVGGIVTIKSEMGQPIHMLATRGVVLWKDLDERVFSIKDPAARQNYLRTHHDDIVARLIRDYAKPWFAVDSRGQFVALENMTYVGVLQRMYRLLYVRHQSRWIDSSYKRLVWDYLVLVAERFGCPSSAMDPAVLASLDTAMQFLSSTLGTAADKVLYHQDVDLLMALFRRRGQKPVPFVPALDEHFETWFKKDCLWQAEDLDAVVDQDVQRISIIHGPVAAQYSTSVEESAVDILDGIHRYYLESLSQPLAVTTVVDALPEAVIDLQELASWKISTQDNITRFELASNTRPPSIAALWRHVSGSSAWLKAALLEDRMFGPHGWTTNPVRAAFSPQLGDIIEVKTMSTADDSIECIALITRRGHDTSGQRTPVIRIALPEPGAMLVTLSPRCAHKLAPRVDLKYTLNQDAAGSRFYACDDTILRNHRALQEFYGQLWTLDYDMSKQPAGLSSEFRGEPLQLTDASVKKFEDVLQRLSPSQIPAWKSSMPLPLDFSVVIAWDVLTKPLMILDLKCDFMRLLHQSVDITQIQSSEPLWVGDTVRTVSRITGLSTMSHGRRIEVTAEILRSDIVVIRVRTEFFIRGGGIGSDIPSFQSVQEPEMLISVDTDVRKAVLHSKEWIHLDKADMESNTQGLTLVFRLTSHKTFNADGQVTSLQVAGSIFALRGSATDLTPVGSVYYEHEHEEVTNVVTDFLSRHGSPRFERQQLDCPGWIAGEDSTLFVTAPAQSGSYAIVSIDHNPIHVCPVFAQYAGLDGVVIHGMNTSAIVHRLLQTALGDLFRDRIHRWKVSFQDVVRPRDLLRVELQHVAMERGAMVVQIQAFNDETGDRVLEAEATVAQASTAYVFGGQGSQAKGMGMELYATSSAAKAVWDRGDTFLRAKYGFSILNIVRENPQHLLVSFGGKRGRQVRSHYLDMTKKAGSAQGDAEEVCIVRDIHAKSTSHTFSESRGLLFSTQFSQPALVLMEMAEYEHLRAAGMVRPDARFAGHSLGEYAALGACTSFMKLEDLLQLVFYRGLKMQNALARDMNGRTDYAMVAVDPSRAGKGLTEAGLQSLVRAISEVTGLLLEVVNYNVDSQQYVCAGHFRTLWILTQILNKLAADASNAVPQAFHKESALRAMIQPYTVTSQSLTNEQVHERGKATIPLTGIDIPFHSFMLRGEIEHYRRFLSTKIRSGDVKAAELVQRWIPNVMGTPFSLDKSYITQVMQKTASEPLQRLVDAMA